METFKNAKQRLCRIKFLSHYGWMGTQQSGGMLHVIRKFLSHYGWMGTEKNIFFRLLRYEVSKPLRLDGDGIFNGK